MSSDAGVVIISRYDKDFNIQDKPGWAVSEVGSDRVDTCNVCLDRGRELINCNNEPFSHNATLNNLY